MTKLPLPWPLGTALAVAGVALATAARLALAPVLGPHYPFVTYFVAAFLTAWACGPGPSALALLLGVLASNHFFLAPTADAGAPMAVRVTGLLLYLFGGSVAILISESERRARRAAEEARGMLDALFDSAPVGMAILDPGLGYRRVNGAMARLGGLPAAEVVGRGAAGPGAGPWPGLEADERTGPGAEGLRGATLPGLAAPEDRGRVEAALASCARGEGPGFEVEARFVRGDGSTLWGRLAGAPIRDDTGRVRAVLCALADITERERAQREMAGLVQRLTTLMDHTPLAVIEWDAGLRVARWSGRAVEIFGWPAAEALGRPIGAFPPVHEEDRAEAEAATARLLDPASKFVVCRLRNATGSGEVIHCDWYSSVLHDEAGRLVAVLSLVLDVTERVRVEEHLRAERERVRRVADAVPALIAYVDADGRYRLNNRAYETWFGLRREEMVGKHMRDVLGEAAWEAIRPHVEEALRGRVVSYEAEAPYRDAGTRWIAATYTPDVGEGGEVRGLFVHVTDITDRHRREEEVRASEARFRQLAEAMPQIVWVADAEGRNTYLNRQWTDTTGRAAEEGMGRRWIEAIHPDDRPGLRARWDECRRDGVPYAAEYRLLGKDGAYRWHIVRGVPIRGEDGRVARWYGSSTDIDEPKRLAEALREDDRRKDEFLAVLAHELRNPLAPIRNAVSVMGMAEDNRETLRWARDVIDRQARHLTSLVDDLLDVSRITRGKIALERVPLGVETFLHAAVEAARPLIDARRHRLEVSIPPGPIRVLGDPTRLTQVVQNLLNNAAKYTPEGGHIRLDVAREGGEVAIRVRDDGLGIPAEMLPKVFDLFTQVDRAIDRSEGGLGIGLTLVRRLVEMHGGTVEARSDGGGAGSEFIVRLPLLPGPTDAASPPPAPSMPEEEGRPRRVLVVDDNVDSAETLARLLRRMGHDVAVVHDGPSAIEAALAAPVDLALLDIGLPGMDGYELARRFRREPALDGIRLVALTGYGNESDRRKSAAAGFDDHFVKPVEFDALRRALERAGVGSA